MLSRREFVGAVGAIAVSAAGAPAAPDRRPKWRVLDLGHDCLLHESLAGFCLAGVSECRPPRDTQESASYIVPAAAGLSAKLMTHLSRNVQAGGRLIFESAAAFGGFEAQRRQLARYFGLTIEPPFNLWTGDASPPYVDYHWPIRVKVRDFSHAVPVVAKKADVIGAIGKIPIAAHAGRFVFLGSPIGPSLLAGDREAHLWFNALLQQPDFPL